ncbi:MAG: terpene cyclase/mutase family protein [Planctomycetes bacterium]|nr:terpene cyclase/mutase family protein [Planctomycetota bacterium]
MRPPLAPLIACLLAVLLTRPSDLRAGDAPAAPAPSSDFPDFDEMTPAGLRSIEKGLESLAQRQSRNGSFGAPYSVAVTGLAGMAFLAHGNFPGEGRYGEQVGGAVRYLMSCSLRVPQGFITEPGGPQSRMHGHGFATMFLCEVFGMERGLSGETRESLRRVIENAVHCIERSQTRNGGWGYEPTPQGGEENSVTVCVVAALRAARNAGIAVEKSCIDRAIRYVKRCHNAGDGSFRYDLSPGGGTFALTAAAVSTLNYLGEYDTSEVRKGIQYLFRHQKDEEARYGHYFYQHFYAALAMWQAGGDSWKNWYPAIRDELVKKQSPDGSWSGDYGLEYSTSWALLILQIPTRYLPVFQR